MCCTPGALVELEVLVDLRLPLALGRLVDRELDPALAVRDDLRHERGVLRRDLLVGEVDHLGHPEDVLVELHPALHLAELDVADDVVDAGEDAVADDVLDRAVARQERAAVAGAVDEAVDRLAVGRDVGHADLAVVVLERLRRRDALGAAGGGLAVGDVDVGDRQRDDLHAVAVAAVVLGDRVVRPQPAGDDDPHAALLEHVRGAVARAGLEAGVRDLVEAEGGAQEVRGLGGVPDPHLDVVDAEQRHRVVRRPRRVFGLSQERAHGASPRSIRRCRC